jgi:hypothetical protein
MPAVQACSGNGLQDSSLLQKRSSEIRMDFLLFYRNHLVADFSISLTRYRGAIVFANVPKRRRKWPKRRLY